MSRRRRLREADEDQCPLWVKLRPRQAGPACPVYPPILLQKSKVASVQIFGQIPKRETIDDSYILSRVTEVAYEFSVSRRGPSDLYTKNAPAALGIFGALCKPTFGTESPPIADIVSPHAQVRSVPIAEV